MLRAGRKPGFLALRVSNRLQKKVHKPTRRSTHGDQSSTTSPARSRAQPAPVHVCSLMLCISCLAASGLSHLRHAGVGGPEGRVAESQQAQSATCAAGAAPWRPLALHCQAQQPACRLAAQTHLNMCMARSSLPSTLEMRNMMTDAGALALVMGFMPFTSGALISTRPVGRGRSTGWVRKARAGGHRLEWARPPPALGGKWPGSLP